MAKLGVITDGISRDLEHALGVMSEVGLDYAELQFLWDKEVGDLDPSEIARVKSLVDSHGVTVSCISRHNFAGLSVYDTEVGDPTFERHMDKLKRCIEMAQLFGTDLVRIMSYRKEMILFGEGTSCSPCLGRRFASPRRKGSGWSSRPATTRSSPRAGWAAG
jgi:sugar phosphate isomerase/epimerase